MDGSIFALSPSVSPADFVRLTRPLPEPHLLVHGTGEVLAVNPSAERLLGTGPLPPGLPLSTLVEESPERVTAYLRACSRSATLLPGSLSLRTGGGAPRRVRVAGAVIVPWTPDAPALLLLRVQPLEEASGRFLVLNQKIEALAREIHVRQQAETTLHAQALQLERLAATLEQTVHELEEQREEAVRARDEAEAASRAKSDFLAVLSHELRTPLNAVLGYAELLDMEIAGPLEDGQRQQLERIRRSAGHLRGLVEEVLTFSRLEAGREQVRTERVDLVSLAREAAELMEPLAAERGLSLALHLSAHPVLVETDPDKLRQILLNLLSNAVKFTDQGSISFVLTPNSDTVTLEVRDTGVGIAAEDMQRIFEPFTQVDSSRTRRAGGTGLGLPVCRELARLLDAELSVSSTPGEGSTFTLILRSPLPPH